MGNHELVGYCSWQDFPAYRLDPPRGREARRVAIVFMTMAEETDTGICLHLHKVEQIEPAQVGEAVACLQKLHSLNMGVHPHYQEKRTHNINLYATGTSLSSVKKTRRLQTVPTEASLPEDPARPSQ